MTRMMKNAATLVGKFPGLVEFTEQDLRDPGEWVDSLRLPVRISQKSRCWMIGPVVFFDKAFMPGVTEEWATKVGAVLMNRVPEKWVAAIVRKTRRLEVAWFFTRERDEVGALVRLRTYPVMWVAFKRPEFRARRGVRRR